MIPRFSPSSQCGSGFNAGESRGGPPVLITRVSASLVPTTTYGRGILGIVSASSSPCRSARPSCTPRRSAGLRFTLPPAKAKLVENSVSFSSSASSARILAISAARSSGGSLATSLAPTLRSARTSSTRPPTPLPPLPPRAPSWPACPRRPPLRAPPPHGCAASSPRRTPESRRPSRPDRFPLRRRENFARRSGSRCAADAVRRRARPAAPAQSVPPERPTTSPFWHDIEKSRQLSVSISSASIPCVRTVFSDRPATWVTHYRSLAERRVTGNGPLRAGFFTGRGGDGAVLSRWQGPRATTARYKDRETVNAHPAWVPHLPGQGLRPLHPQ